MTDPLRDKRIGLLKVAGMLQVKLLLNGARDFLLMPAVLVAVLIDMAFAERGEPRCLRAVLRLGERIDDWIDMWAAAREDDTLPRENVDALLERVETVLRDPQTGARRARVLRRWAERQARRARQRAVEEVVSRLPKPPEPPKH